VLLSAIEAVNIARKYNVPVFVLSDQALSPRASRPFTSRSWRRNLPGHLARPDAVADYKPMTSPHRMGDPRVVPGRADFERPGFDCRRSWNMTTGPSDRRP